MMMQAVDPERALIAAGIMVISGIITFFIRNRKILRYSPSARGGGDISE